LKYTEKQEAGRYGEVYFGMIEDEGIQEVVAIKKVKLNEYKKIELECLERVKDSPYFTKLIWSGES
jgi:hypothetical protein